MWGAEGKRWKEEEEEEAENGLKKSEAWWSPSSFVVERQKTTIRGGSLSLSLSLARSLARSFFLNPPVVAVQLLENAFSLARKKVY